MTIIDRVWFNQRGVIMKKINFTIVAILISFLMSGCVGKDALKKTIEENPEIITNMIEKHPKKFLDAVNKAVENARSAQRKDQAKKEDEALEDEFKNPKKPEVSDSRVLLAGSKSAPITIIEYSDFQCPYCTKGFEVMNSVKAKYGDKVRIVYKHLPLDFHPQAEPAARYFEAIALQSHSKAKKFHDMIFQNQGDLKSGKTDFLNGLVKKVGANLSKVLKDIESSKVKSIVEKDMSEARKFGFSGTPGFLVNGVSVKGAYPLSHFEKLIDRHLKK